MSGAGAEPLVSIVVIGRNEGERLQRCLQSVRTMNAVAGGLELIYVDSDSTDDSVRRAAEHGAHVIPVHSTRPTAALGRNAGWRAASGQYVLFLDGDTVLHPDFVAASLPEFRDPKVAVVWGHRREINARASVYNRVLDIEWVYAPGVSEFCGGDALMRRSVLEETGGFDAGLIAGEEPELCRRIRERGYVILHVDRPMTGHDLAILHWSQYWKRCVRTGYAYAAVSTRFADTGSPLWKQDARRNLHRGAFLLLLVGCAAAASLLWRTLFPICAASGIFLLLALRTAHKAAWKSPDRLTRFLYGVHSHLQQVPMLFGQLAFRWDRRVRRQRQLIEYKQP